MGAKGDSADRLADMAAAVADSAFSRQDALATCKDVAAVRRLSADDFHRLVEEVERLSGWRLDQTGPRT